MARRRSSSIEEVFDTLQTLPWWVGVAFAAGFWIAGHVIIARTVGNPMMTAIRPILQFLFYGFAIASLLAAAVSAIKSLSRRNLLNRQSGIESLRSLTWREFEHLVGEAFRRQGYDVEESGGGGADGGIDLVLRGHGETVLVQCKQWKVRQVGVDKVRELFGVVTSERAERGILVTSGVFTNDAHSFKVGKPLTLIDGPALVDLVRNVQPASPSTPPLPPQPMPASTNACPRCDSPMTLRTAKRGSNAGSSFYGCTRYPSCKGTRPAE